MSENEVIPASHYRVDTRTEPVPATPMAMIQTAVARGASVDELGKLMDLQERYEKTEARKAFVSALNAFKMNPPKIRKDKTVDFTSQKGRTHYKHASLDNVSDLIGEALAKVGISHRWETEQLEGGMIRVTCVLTHALGHAERVSLQAGRDDSGNKNNIQAVGSTVSYLQRYTLLTATGMAVSDADDDGRQGKGLEFPEDEKSQFLSEIDMLETSEQSDSLWSRIAKASKSYGDVEAHDELRAAMAKKRKSLKSAPKVEI